MPSTRINSDYLAIIGLCSALAFAGCAHNNVHAVAPVTVAPQPDAERPMNVAPDTDALPPQPPGSPAPVLSADDTAPSIAAIAKPKMPAPPPRAPVEQPSAEPSVEASNHAPAPQISPQLSQTDQQNYERQTNDDVAVAERNLQQANGKSLKADQRYLLENVRSYLGQSRDAIKAGDWERAQKLAQKARVLSVELVNSF